jgi:hypothetical protein
MRYTRPTAFSAASFLNPYLPPGRFLIRPQLLTRIEVLLAGRDPLIILARPSKCGVPHDDWGVGPTVRH